MFILIICKKDLILTLMMESPSINNKHPSFLNHNNLGNKFNEITSLNKIELSVDGPILLANFCFKITTNYKIKMAGKLFLTT